MMSKGTMTDRRCAQCGHANVDAARFCALCGQAMTPPASGTPSPGIPGATAPAPSGSVAKKTMMGFAPLDLSALSASASARPAASPPTVSPPQVAPAAPGTAPAPAAARPVSPPAAGGFRRTVMGIADPGVPVQAPAREPAKAPVPRGTMLGVAMPGIAPLSPGQIATPPPPAPAPRPPSRAAAPAPPIVPAPAPLAEMVAPAPIRIVRKKGVPATVAVAISAAVLLAGGLTLLWFWRSAPTIEATLTTSPEGADVLGLHCDPGSCKDGTSVTVDTVRTTFSAGAANLTLPQQLPIGDNRLALHVDRPGWGRDDVIEVLVPVSFRIHADVSTMSGDPPAIAIRAACIPGSTVTVDGHPVSLDPSGAASYSVDESGPTTGPADESQVVSAQVSYAVTRPGGAAQTGTVSARVVVAPLRVDSPGAHAIVDGDHVVVAGRAAKGATVTVEGAPATVEDDGSFEATVPLGAVGVHTLSVRSGTAALTPRTVRVDVKRVASLTLEAKARDRAKSVGYDAAKKDPASHLDAPIVVDGDVVDARSSGHRTVALVDDRHGCAKGPCVARVAFAQELSLSHGASVRVYGRVAAPIPTSSGPSVLDVNGDFFVPSKP